MNNYRAFGLALVLALPVAGLVSCSGDNRGELPGQAMASEAAVEVVVAQFRYAPARVEVPAGAVVRWLNSDEILHTATAGSPGQPTGTFDGQMPGAGTAFEFTFSDPGTYHLLLLPA